MITTEIKDRILFDLTSRDSIVFHYSSVDIAQRLNLSCEVVTAVIKHFVKIGFIKLFRPDKPYAGDIEMQIEAYDFANRGGFLVQEELLKANIQKLGLEIDVLAKELSPKGLETAEKIATIGSSILSAIGMMR
ncbi:MAG: hypothetical protein U0M63_01025 [Alistipes onderdonkii]|jgi:hypothetical protein|nr:hypothetical protein [Alistipes onderdonkii]MEE0848235.1 hypothetical protein [Alistipes onderdonkii]